MIRGTRIALAREQTRNGELPDYCIGCGCLLEGGRTQHELDCPILAMIQEAFPGKETKEGEQGDQQRRPLPE